MGSLPLFQHGPLDVRGFHPTVLPVLKQAYFVASHLGTGGLLHFQSRQLLLTSTGRIFLNWDHGDYSDLLLNILNVCLFSRLLRCTKIRIRFQLSHEK